MIKLPQGIRVPRDDEYPGGHDIKEINEKREKANIIEGYVIREVEGKNFNYYAKINIDCDRLWDIFIRLAVEIIPESAYGIISFKEGEAKLSRFTKREKVLTVLEDFKYELINDGYLEFGIAQYDEHTLNEIFVKSFKYLSVWTTKEKIFINVMREFGLREIPNLEFIDQYPVVSEALTGNTENRVRHYSEVQEGISEKFEQFSDS